MPRVCTICTRTDREVIDSALIAAESLRNIAKRFGTSVTVLFRHKTAHIPAFLAKAKKASEVAKADTLLARVGRLCDRSEHLLDESEAILAESRQGRNGKVALEAIRTAAIAARELRGHFALLGQLSGELREAEQGRVQAIIILPPTVAARGEPAKLTPKPWQKGLLAPAQDQSSSQVKGEVIDVESVADHPEVVREEQP